MGLSKLSSDLLRGNTDTLILRVLMDSDSYGYQIVQVINERSQGEYELKQATMYSSVRRLELSGDIVWYWGDESQGGRRKYFKITKKGLDTYKSSVESWRDAKRILDNLID